MFRVTSPQSSMFEVESMLPGALPESDWAFIFREEVLPLIDEEAFRPFQSTDRPLDPADFDVQLDQSGDLVVVFGHRGLEDGVGVRVIERSPEKETTASSADGGVGAL